MKMASTNQPLLNSPKKTPICCKFFYFAAASFTLLTAVSFLVPILTKTSYNDHSDMSYLCQGALFPKICQEFVSEVVFNGTAKPTDSTVLLKNLLMKEVHQMKSVHSLAGKLRNDQFLGRNEHLALADCLELMDLSIDLVLDSVKALKNDSVKSHANARAWLSGVLTNHVTCFEGLEFSSRKSMAAILEDLILRSRASLAILAAVEEPDNEETVSFRRMMPSWIEEDDRKILQKPADAIVADLIVAQDGSGNYLTVAEAVAAAPNKTKTRFLIYVKRGIYKENVEVGKNKKNLMIVGDGMDLTVITGDRNVVDGSTTFKSATLG